MTKETKRRRDGLLRHRLRGTRNDRSLNNVCNDRENRMNNEKHETHNTKRETI